MKHITFAVVCAVFLAEPAWGDWSEDFQSYDAGSRITGQGGWTGWDGDTSFLAEVSTEHAKFTGDKVLKAFAGNDMVQQYTGYDAGAWVYKAKQYIPAERHGTGNTFLILMNNYNIGGNKGWGLQLAFDLTNDVVWDQEASEGFLPILYDQWVELRVEIDLEANFRTTYYNGTLVGRGPWYDTADASHAKSVAAVDLWADAGGDPVYYDDFSLTPGTPVTLGQDITTHGSVLSRYLVNLGRGYGDTVKTGRSRTKGLFEIASGGGNQQAWWRLNDGDPAGGSKCVTYYGASPDYFGYRFKLPATVNQVIWYNYVFGDGGTFDAAPEVQYLDAVDGTWHTITDVTWDRPYNSTYVTFGHFDGARRYVVTLNNPPKAIWGLRLYGETKPGTDDVAIFNQQPEVPDVPGTGFVGVTEMTLYGQLELGTLDLNTNLALSQAVIASDSQFANMAVLTNGDVDGDFDTTWNPAEPEGTHEDYVGVTWPTPQNNVAAMGVVFNGFNDGGYFDPCSPIRIEYTQDGTTWTPVTGLDLGRFPGTWFDLRARPWAPDTAFLFRFDAVNGITGLRIIGDPDGYTGGDLDGFIGCFEVEVFANATPLSDAAQPRGAELKARIIKSVESLRAIVAL